MGAAQVRFGSHGGRDWAAEHHRVRWPNRGYPEFWDDAHHIMHTLMVTTYADIMYPPDSEIIG